MIDLNAMLKDQQAERIKVRQPDHQFDTMVMGKATTVDIFCEQVKGYRGNREEPAERGGDVVEYVKIFGEVCYSDESRELAQSYVDEVQG